MEEYVVEVTYSDSYGMQTKLYDGFESKDAAEMFAESFIKAGYQAAVTTA